MTLSYDYYRMARMSAWYIWKFAKYFDKVDFMVTMRKLQEMGIKGNLGRWIHAFLTHRKQAILVNGARSEPTEVKCGVPQGSVFGPLLFLVLIGDIDRKVAQAYVSSFAEDTRVSLGVTSEDDTISACRTTWMPYITGRTTITWNLILPSSNA